MSKYLPATVGIAVMLIASPALAKERSALESASIETSIKAALDCVAGEKGGPGGPDHWNLRIDQSSGADTKTGAMFVISQKLTIGADPAKPAVKPPVTGLSGLDVAKICVPSWMTELQDNENMSHLSLVDYQVVLLKARPTKVLPTILPEALKTEMAFMAQVQSFGCRTATDEYAFCATDDFAELNIQILNPHFRLLNSADFMSWKAILDMGQQWGQNPMDEEMNEESATVGEVGLEDTEDVIYFSALNREALLKMPFSDHRIKTREMFSPDTVGLPIPAPTSSRL